MSDAEWKRAITRAANAAVKHRELLAIAEAEYEARYGENPSDIDDDNWIDIVHLGGIVDMKLIKQQAEFSISLRHNK